MPHAIFYAEFDNIAGPQILYQAPNEYLSNEVFDSISDYIIIDKPLCGKIVTLVLPPDQTIVGYPVCIEDDKYHRNALLFNIGFVFQRDANTAPYIPILEKIGSLLETMEKETGFLSSPASKELLSGVLRKIQYNLAQVGECNIPADPANIINLKVYPKMPDPPVVQDHQVPIPTRDLTTLLRNHAEWDLALEQIIPHIDGVNYVQRIALQSNVQVDIVKNCMRQLLYYDCITMIDIFQYSNIYATTSQLNRLARDERLQIECLSYIKKDGADPIEVKSFRKIFALYCSIQPGLRVSDFCILYGNSLKNVDVARFIAFGLIHSFLRRVHKYPVRPERRRGRVKLTNSRSSGTGGGPRNGPAETELYDSMDGNHNTDEICCRHLLDYAELDVLVANDMHSFVVHK